MESEERQKRNRARRRQKLIRRGVLVGASAVFVVLVVAGLLRNFDDASPSASGAVPGYEEYDRTPDTSPFELARPNHVGASTIPFLDPEPFVPSTTSPPPLATTTIPDLPNVGTDPVCAAAISIAEVLTASSLGGNQPVVPEGIAETFSSAASQLESTGDSAFLPMVNLLRFISAGLESATTPAEVRAVVDPLLAPTDPGVSASLAEVLRRSEQSCPGLDRGIG